MNPPATRQVSVTFSPTFSDLFLATLAITLYRKRLLALHAVFPLVGISMLIFVAFAGKPITFGMVLIALVCVAFTPIMVALMLWSTRLKSKLTEGPITYRFDAIGMHLSNAVFSQTILWAALVRVRQSRRFFFIFIAPAYAHFIPVKVLRDQGVLDELRNLVSQHADCG
jgi:hypothetical protein